MRGATLVEMMIITAIMALVAYIASSFFLESVNMKNKIGESAGFNIEVDRAMVQIEQIASQAIDVVPGAPANLEDITNGSGKINTSFDSDFAAPNSALTTPVAVFLREAANLSVLVPVVDRSQFLPTGIYFQQPSPTTSGVLYIATGSPTPGNQTISPSRGSLFFSRIVRFQTMGADTTNGLRALNFVITFRKFTDPNPSGWMWCPQIHVTAGFLGCVAKAPYMDVTQTIRVTFRNNNLINPKDARPLRAFGGIYFFNYAMPRF